MAVSNSASDPRRVTNTLSNIKLAIRVSAEVHMPLVEDDFRHNNL